MVCQSLAILFCKYFLNTSWQLWRIKAMRSVKEWKVLQAEATEAGQLGPLTNSAHTILAQLLTTV